MQKSDPKTKAPRRERHNEPVQPGQLLLFKPQVVALTGVCYSTLYVWMRAGQFPQAVVLGPATSRTATVAWHADEIYQWIAALPRREPGTHEFRGRGASDANKPKPKSKPKPKPKPARSRPSRAASSDNMEFETTTPAAREEAGVP